MSTGKVRVSEWVRAPVARVFAALTDFRRTPEWDARISEVTQMTRGALRPGVIIRSTFAVGDETYHEDDEVTDYQPPNRFGLRSVLGTTSAVTYTLSEEDLDRTRVDVVLDYDLPDPPPGSGGDAEQLRQAIASALTHSLGLFREVVEREEAGKH
jgi:uncharacterized protein YndB with AHSA1/START domain